MKVALLSESPADEAALRVLVTAVLGHPPHFVTSGLRARGWPNVAQVLPAVIRHLHFNTDTDVLGVVVDADDSVVHTSNHDAPGYFHPNCRMCQLRAVFRQTTKRLPAAHGRNRVLRGVGIAVPAIEAWYLCGRDPQVSEAAWIDGQERGQPPYTRPELKLRVYGTDRPSLPHEIGCALREVARLRTDPRRLENDFPGFAALARDLRHIHTAPGPIPAQPGTAAGVSDPHS
ncbi:MAG TPA: hypothetical protein VHE61_18840 [Opitutaceae bacterium]|nr:hypothetical protein [Opitutaceae bacterium]